MSEEKILMDEDFMLIEGIAVTPMPIMEHLWNNKEATLEELKDLFGFRSKRFVESWLRNAMNQLVVERFWYPKTDKHTYALTKFARHMLEHIRRRPWPGTGLP